MTKLTLAESIRNTLNLFEDGDNDLCVAAANDILKLTNGDKSEAIEGTKCAYESLGDATGFLLYTTKELKHLDKSGVVGKYYRDLNSKNPPANASIEDLIDATEFHTVQPGIQSKITDICDGYSNKSEYEFTPYTVYEWMVENWK